MQVAHGGVHAEGPGQKTRDGEGLSDSEFEQVKNQLQFSSFYKAGEWLVGENGKVMVHVQRDMEKLHLVVMNHEHIAGGSSVYEVYFFLAFC